MDFVPSEIIYNISTNFILETLPRYQQKELVLEDTIPAAKEGKIQELVINILGR